MRLSKEGNGSPLHCISRKEFLQFYPKVKVLVEQTSRWQSYCIIDFHMICSKNRDFPVSCANQSRFQNAYDVKVSILESFSPESPECNLKGQYLCVCMFLYMCVVFFVCVCVCMSAII